MIEGFGLWGVMLFFMLSGYLLADTFWRPRASATCGSTAIRRFFRIAPAYYVYLGLLFLFFAAHKLVFSEQGAKQLAANVTFTHYLFPNYSSSLNVNGALWTLTIEMLLYAFLPLMALLVRFNPWLGTAILIAIGLGWRAWVAFDGDWLRRFYFGDIQFNLGIESLFISRQFLGALSIFALGILARWLVVHGHLDRVYSRLPARLGVSSFLVLMMPSIAMLYWVERGTLYTNRMLFTVYDFGLMLLLVPAWCWLPGPRGSRPARFARPPPGWGSAATASTCGTSRSSSRSYERGPSGGPRRRRLLVAAAADPGPDPRLRDRELPPRRAPRHGVGPPPGQARLGGIANTPYEQGDRHVMKLPPSGRAHARRRVPSPAAPLRRRGARLPHHGRRSRCGSRHPTA